MYIYEEKAWHNLSSIYETPKNLLNEKPASLKTRIVVPHVQPHVELSDLAKVMTCLVESHSLEWFRSFVARLRNIPYLSSLDIGS